MKAVDGHFQLIVVPLHGLGNKNGEGTGVRILAYDVPEDPHGEWNTHLISDTMHMTHNLEVFDDNKIFVAGREGILACYNPEGGREWGSLIAAPSRAMKAGAGEVRRYEHDMPMCGGIATIEPMHGNAVAFYFTNADVVNNRTILDESLAEGHALACADLLGMKRDQIVAGWRARTRRRRSESRCTSRWTTKARSGRRT